MALASNDQWVSPPRRRPLPGRSGRPAARPAERRFRFIRAGLLALYAFVALFVVGIAVKFSRDLEAVEIKEERAHLLSLARALEQHTTLLVDAASQYVFQLRDTIEAEGGVEAMGAQRLTDLMATRTSIDRAVRRVYVADRNGKMIATAPTATREVKGVEEREYFRAHRASAARNARVSEALETRSGAGWVLPVTVRLDRPDGSFGGVVRLSLDVNYFAGFYESLQMVHQGSVALVGTDGRFLMRHPDMELARTHPLPPSMMENRETEGTLEAISPVDGERRVIAYRKVSGLPVFVLVSSSKASVLAHAMERRWITGGIALAVLAGLGIFIRLILVNLERERQQLAEIRELNTTLEKRVEERTAELTRANAELESFSYSVSHDLRAPLRHLAGYAQILGEEAGEPLDAESRRLVERIGERAGYMNALIEGLLALSRVTRAPLTREAIGLSALAREILHDLGESDGGRKVDVSIAPGLEARGDRVLVRTLLQNLLGNAWKYSSRNAAARIEVGATTQDGETVFHVRDNGVGFDPQHADKLFGAFQRLHAASEFEGTGIGLATARRIVQRHGGRIWAEATPGEGATFRFTLPAAGQPEG